MEIRDYKDIFLKLNSTSIAFILLLAVSVICPGCLYFYLYQPDMFFKIDVSKLILISIAITLPFYCFNTGVYYFLETFSNGKETDKIFDKIYFASINGAGTNVILFYLSLVIFIKEDYSLIAFLQRITFTEIVIVGFLVVIYSWRTWSNKKKNKQAK